MNELRDRVAVITGGASGIGLATARRLAEEGMRLVLADIEEEPLDRAARELRDRGTEVLALPSDVADRAQVEALAAETYARFGATHLLFNNAGVAIFGGIETMRHEDWEWLVGVNLWGVVHGIESFVPRMIEQGGSEWDRHVVNTASFAGLVPNQGLGVYCATKYAVVGISEVLQRDLSGYGIGVSVLCPMVVETNINASARNRPPGLGGAPAQGFPPADADPAPPRAIVGGVIKAEEVAERVLEGIRGRKLYIFTHEAARPFIRRRFERIDRAF